MRVFIFLDSRVNVEHAASYVVHGSDRQWHAQRSEFVRLAVTFDYNMHYNSRFKEFI